MLNGVNMKITEIIKEAFEFPSKNLGTLAILVVLSVLVGSFVLSGFISLILGMHNSANVLMGLLSLIISLLIGWVLAGYQISIIKSGINHDEKVPEFEWKENFLTGINNFVVTFVYILIPTIIVIIVGFITNVPGSIMAVINEITTQIYNVYTGLPIVYALDAISQTIAKLPGSLAIPIIVALVVFIIFLFLETMAEGRLAKTGDLMEALNVLEAAKDMKKIGVVKVISLIVTLVVTLIVIDIILSFIFSLLPFLSTLSIIITPYLIFFTQRAVGLLYSDIA